MAGKLWARLEQKRASADMDALLASGRLPSEPLGGGNIEAIWRRDPLTEPDSSRETVGEQLQASHRCQRTQMLCLRSATRKVFIQSPVTRQIETMNSVLCIMLARRI